MGNVKTVNQIVEKDEVLSLPTDFLKKKGGDFSLHFYETTASSSKNKVELSQHLLCLLIQGKKTINGSTTSATLHNTEIALVTAGNVLMTERITTTEGNYKSILFFFSNRFLIEYCSKYQLIPSPSDKTADDLIRFQKDPFLLHFIHSLEFMPPSLQQESFEALKLEELIHYLCIQYPTEMGGFIKNVLRAQHHLTLQQVVHQHTYSNLTIEELAFLCHQSTSSFKRHFTALFHTTPKKYFVEKRMHKAQQLLQLHQRPSAIYSELGYESLASFSAEFKKYSGISPKQYQSQLDQKTEIIDPITQ